MHDLLSRPYWEYTATVAVVSAAVFLATRGRGTASTARVAAFACDLSIIAAVFAIYQHTVHYAHNHTKGASDRAADIYHFEGRLHIPGELWVQNLVIHHPPVVKALNAYYAGVHLPLTICFVLWVLWFHRDAYPGVRNVLAMSTLACVLIQTVPVAPPRLMPQFGFIDTALAYGQSVYGPGGNEVAGQLAAMPSIHVAWAAIVAWYVYRLSTNPVRWVFVVHFFMTMFVIVATANHWWADGAVAVAIVAAAIYVQSRIEALRKGPAGGASGTDSTNRLRRDERGADDRGTAGTAPSRPEALT